MTNPRDEMREKLSEYRTKSEALERMEIRRRRVLIQLEGVDSLDDLEAEILLQKSSCAASLAELLNLISFFPAGGRKHEIMSLKYIDDLPWWQIGEQMYLSESACRKLEQQAIDELIQLNNTKKSP